MPLMYHPDLPDAEPREVSQRHFDLIWSDLGWRLTDDPAPEGPTPPNKSASKADWEAFAVAQGMSEENAHGATKDELIDRFGG